MHLNHQYSHTWRKLIRPKGPGCGFLTGPICLMPYYISTWLSDVTCGQVVNLGDVEQSDHVEAVGTSELGQPYLEFIQCHPFQRVCSSVYGNAQKPASFEAILSQ
ncbi:hypothetical protein U1Q18_006160 [Sarracenia purpurea var. burkii]